MSRQPRKPSKGMQRIHLLLPGPFVSQLDQKASELQAEVPGSSVTRTEVIRRALYAFVVKSEAKP